MIRRRALLKGVTAAASLPFAMARGDAAAAEPPPEVTRIRLTQNPGICIAPQYIAADLLRLEGFKDVEYVEYPEADPYSAFTKGDVDVGMAFVAPFLVQVDAGAPVVLLAGIHAGCFELFGTGSARSIRDLKGRRVGIPGLGSAHRLFLSSMAAYVGIDPRKDIEWVVHKPVDSAPQLTERRVDALMAFPPVPQELRARGIGQVIVNSAVDRPWSQYFCCMIAARRSFIEKYPAATKRVVRAVLKAADICALEPERAARLVVERGFGQSYDHALSTMKEIPYRRWREYDPDDSVRFYALRLREIGEIKGNPHKLIAQGTDWRFFKELRKELKA